MCVPTCVHTYIRTHTHTHTRTHTHKHTRTHAHTLKHARTQICKHTPPLIESGKRDEEDTAGLLAMAPKRVGCFPFLPTTEIDSYRERSESDRQRERVSERTSFREIELEREQVLERE